MKYWLSHLPLEVWVSVFCYPWISREELAKIVHRFGNRKYAEYLQFFLHDWGKQKLKHNLHFDKDGLYKYVDRAQYRLHFPQTPMPGNIKSFNCISISHFDAQTMDFLHQISPILSELKLHCLISNISSNQLENLRIILTNLHPLLDGFHSMHCDMNALATVKQCFGEKLAKMEELTINHSDAKKGIDDATRQTTVDFVTEWLNSPEREGIGPKWCEAFIYKDKAFGPQISSAFRRQFLLAKTPCTFAVLLNFFACEWYFAEFHLKNGIGEELRCEQIGIEYFLITRHRANRGKEWQAWIDEHDKATNYGSRIEIERPTIGLLDARMDVPEDHVEDGHQPSTSKKARIS